MGADASVCLLFKKEERKYMGLSVIKMVLPVLIMILIGYFTNKKGLITQDGLAGIKAFVSKITLPVVLFNAFFTADYTKTTVISFALVYIALGLALVAGFALKKLALPFDKFMPLLVTGWEGGMLGYALFALLYGAGSTKVFAVVDIGQTVFGYTVFISTLKAIGGERPGVKALAMGMIKNPPSAGMLLGIVLGATGVHSWIANTSIFPPVQAVIEFIAAPTSALILLVLGYELSFKRSLMKPVMRTVLIRLMVMALMCAATAFVLFQVIPYDKQLLVALMLGFSLPAPFIIPLFADVSGHGEYISTSLSVQTLLSVALFAGIAVFTLA